MSRLRLHPPRPLPVLTEIVEGPPPRAAASGASAGDSLGTREAEFVGRVMRELELQLDLLLESRMREILGPAIARATDELLRETRADLGALLVDIVSRALAQDAGRIPPK